MLIGYIFHMWRKLYVKLIGRIALKKKMRSVIFKPQQTKCEYMFTTKLISDTDINRNAELNIVEELTNSRNKQQQQTFMNPPIRSKQNNLKPKGSKRSKAKSWTACTIPFQVFMYLYRPNIFFNMQNPSWWKISFSSRSNQLWISAEKKRR